MRRIRVLLIAMICLSGIASIGLADTPEQALAAIAKSLESGDIDTVLSRFIPKTSAKSQQVLTTLDEAGRKRLARSFRGAKLKDKNSGYCLVNVPTEIPNGETIDSEMMLVPDGKGGWVINAW